MIDLHSHVLYGIDDGARTIEESVSLLKKMKEIGIEVVVATPHYMTGTSYTADNISKSYRLGQIKERLKEENIQIDLYLGNEVFIDHTIHPLVKEGKIATIRGTKYILVEFPRNSQMIHLESILFQLRSRGYVPIIAHPERYLFLQEDYRLLNQFLSMGCLFQGNLENSIGRYGKEAQKLFWYMLKNDKYQFLATDVHHDTDSLFSNFQKIKNNIVKCIGEEKYYVLTHVHPMKVLKNAVISVGDITPIVKKFGHWR